MYEIMGCLDRLLENNDTPAKRQERNIVAVLIILINLLAAVMIPLCPAIVFISNSKVSFSTFALTVSRGFGTCAISVGKPERATPRLNGKQNSLKSALVLTILAR